MAPNRRFKKSRKERRKSFQISKDDLKYIGIKQKLEPFIYPLLLEIIFISIWQN